MYTWRKLSRTQRAEWLAGRRAQGRPWHGPPHFDGGQQTFFHLSAACYEHLPLIGLRPERMEAFTAALLGTVDEACERAFAWCVLPNHYHLLVETRDLRLTMRLLGRLHGRSSFVWNTEDNRRGRTCFHRTADRVIRGDRHFWATMNYIHHNPVHHGLVEQWTEWPWSSAHEFLAGLGRDEAARIWREYPLLDYGAKWDPPVSSPAFRRPGGLPASSGYPPGDSPAG